MKKMTPSERDAIIAEQWWRIHTIDTMLERPNIAQITIEGLTQSREDAMRILGRLEEI